MKYYSHRHKVLNNTRTGRLETGSLKIDVVLPAKFSSEEEERMKDLAFRWSQLEILVFLSLVKEEHTKYNI